MRRECDANASSACAVVGLGSLRALERRAKRFTSGDVKGWSGRPRRVLKFRVDPRAYLVNRTHARHKTHPRTLRSTERQVVAQVLSAVPPSGSRAAKTAARPSAWPSPLRVLRSTQPTSKPTLDGPRHVRVSTRQRRPSRQPRGKRLPWVLFPCLFSHTRPYN